jgi:hypothetical protein
VLRTSRVPCWPESSRVDQQTMPTLVELVVPFKPYTQIAEVVGGLTKLVRLLEMQADATPWTRMPKKLESKSKLGQRDLFSEIAAAALACAIPVARADKASSC